MPNAKAHRLGAAFVIGSTLAIQESKRGEVTARPLLGAAGGALLGTLPDIIEPALHPNHRQFFHSLGMVGLVGMGLYKLNEWKPDNDFDKTVKFFGMVAAGAYLVHLAMDSNTSKSLPMV